MESGAGMFASSPFTSITGCATCALLTLVLMQCMNLCGMKYLAENCRQKPYGKHWIVNLDLP